MGRVYTLVKEEKEGPEGAEPGSAQVAHTLSDSEPTCCLLAALPLFQGRGDRTPEL